MNFKKVKKWFKKNVTFDRVIAILSLGISVLSLIPTGLELVLLCMFIGTFIGTFIGLSIRFAIN
jgi:hypothetical protein